MRSIQKCPSSDTSAFVMNSFMLALGSSVPSALKVTMTVVSVMR